MASVTYMTSMMNCVNDMRRDILSEVMNSLDTKELLTDDIKDVLTEMISSVKTNKKVAKKEKTPRFSGYHLFMKEHRVVVKTEQPDIKPQDLTSVVAKAWKDVPEEQKQEFNARALKMKEDYNNLSDNNKSDSDSDKAESSTKKKPVAKKEKKKPTEKKTNKSDSKKTEKKAKKPVSPPSSDDESDDEVDIHIKDVESDIDI
jgi:high mobility group protein B2